MLCDQISNLKTNRCFRRFSRIKWAAWAYFGLAALPISTYAQAQTIESPNNRRKDFYDILQNVKDRKIDDFWTRVLKFQDRLFLRLAYDDDELFYASLDASAARGDNL